MNTVVSTNNSNLWIVPESIMNTLKKKKKKYIIVIKYCENK